MNTKRVNSIVRQLPQCNLSEINAVVETLRVVLGKADMDLLVYTINHIHTSTVDNKTKYKVRLKDYDAGSKIRTIKVIREYTHVGLLEAKVLADRVPSVVHTCGKETAMTMLADLLQAGAQAEVVAVTADVQPLQTVDVP